MKTQILFTVLRVSISLVIGILLFPYCEDYVDTYSNEIALFMLFSSIIRYFFRLILKLLLGISIQWMFKDKLDVKLIFFFIIDNLFFILLYILVVLTTLSITHWYWALLILLILELIWYFSNREEEKLQEGEIE